MTTIDQPPVVSGFSQPLEVMGCSAAGVRSDQKWAVGTLIFGFIFLVGGVLVSQVPGREQGWIFGLVVFVLCLLVSGYFFFDLLRIKGRRIWLFPEGIVDSHFGNDKGYRWDEIDEIVYWSNIADIAIRTTSGDYLAFGFMTIDRADKLARSVVEYVVPVMAPRLAQEIRSGASLSFGRIDADKFGLTIHYRAHKSNKPNSFYKGPWPRSDYPTNLAKAQQRELVRVAWRDIIALNESNESNLVLITPTGPIPLCCWPNDVPNSIALLPVAKLMTGWETGPS